VRGRRGKKKSPTELASTTAATAATAAAEVFSGEIAARDVRFLTYASFSGKWTMQKRVQAG